MTPAQLTLVSPEPTQTESIRIKQRDRYFDLLRVLAIAQVLAVHLVSFTWAPAVYPAMGIGFAIAGSLVAGSLDRSAHQPLPVIKKRVVRLLAPLWAMAAVLAPAVVVVRLTNASNGTSWDITPLLKWIVPVSPPSASDLGFEMALPFWMWALSCYLWLLVLSPALLWLFRRWPKRTMAVPAAILLLNTAGLAPLNDDAGDVVLNLSTFAACWLLGFAHHDGRLDRIRLLVVLAVGAALYGLGIASAHAFQPLDQGPVPEETPLAYALLSIGLVLVLLRLHPVVHGRLGEHRFLTNLVTAVNYRAMTIWIWSSACISLRLFLTQVASEQTWWPPNLPELVWEAMPLAVSTVLLVVCAICFGWIEDKTAGRPARINPWPVNMNTFHLAEPGSRDCPQALSATLAAPSPTTRPAL